jgi:hypothetical protein
MTFMNCFAGSDDATGPALCATFGVERAGAGWMMEVGAMTDRRSSYPAAARRSTPRLGEE